MQESSVYDAFADLYDECCASIETRTNRRIKKAMIMQQQDPKDSRIGRVVAGYRLLELAGAGGTGRVYKAVNESGDVVAVKVIDCHQYTEASLAAWRREARLVERISHPNLIKVFAADQTSDFDYCIYEWAENGSLADLIRGDQLPIDRVVEFAAKVALGCEALHASRILHRDIKPSNVLLDGRGEIKLADFGAARVAGETIISDSVGCIGTPGYMSPEQLGLIDAPVAEATDVFAIGALMYAMLTGKGPFSGGSTIEVIARSARGEFDRPSLLRPIPEPLERICLKCLEQLPSNRYPSVTKLYQDLQNFREGREVQASPTCLTNHARHSKRSLNKVLSGATLAAALVIVALAVVWRATIDNKGANVAEATSTDLDQSPWESPIESEVDEQVALDRIAELGGSVKRRDDLVVAVDLNKSSVADEDLKLLGAFTKLDAVLLEQTRVSIAGIRSLPDNIRRLDLGGTLIGNEDFDLLADRIKLTSVSFLASPLTDLGVERLCKNRQLMELTLQSELVTDRAIDAIAACEQLESLVLNGCTALTSGGIAKLSRCSKLRYLHVGQTGVDDAALAQLCTNCALKELGLCVCQKVSDQTMEILLTCPTLEDIFVDGTSVSTAGLLKLAALPNLRRIVARGNNVDLSRLELKFNDHVAFVTHW